MKSLILLIVVIIGSCFCKSIKQTKIVGGDFAKVNQFPHQVALLYRGSLRCGGSIIRSDFILTASHCLVGDYENLVVLAGTNNLKEGGERRKVSKEIRHELYGNFKNDIALMLLSRPYEFSSSIQKIPLENDELNLGSEVQIIGFGKTSNWGFISSILKYNTVKVSSTKGCFGLGYDGIVCFGHEINNGACNVSETFLYFRMTYISKSCNFFATFAFIFLG